MGQPFLITPLLLSVGLFFSRITQELLNRFTWNLAEGWGHGPRKKKHDILPWIKREELLFFLRLMAGIIFPMLSLTLWDIDIFHHFAQENNSWILMDKKVSYLRSVHGLVQIQIKICLKRIKIWFDQPTVGPANKCHSSSTISYTTLITTTLPERCFTLWYFRVGWLQLVYDKSRYCSSVLCLLRIIH